MKEKINIELSAEIRNKLQSAHTVLELLKKNKEVSKDLVNRAIKDLEEITKIVG